MKVFILEDNSYRIRALKEKFKRHEVHIFDNVKDAIRGYDDDYDLFLLDHDLDGQVYVDSEKENTGYQLAKWLARKENIFQKRIIAHTMNITGAQNIQAILPHAEIMPYPQLIENYVDFLLEEMEAEVQ
jgi:hypothetical protein